MRTPTLIIQAQNDQIVYGGIQNEFCREHPSCQLIVAPQSNHDILSEHDRIRTVVLKTITAFF